MSEAASAGASGVMSQGTRAVLWAMAGRLSETGKAVLKQAKPWSEIMDRTALTKPANFGEATTRIRKNAKYFGVNYLIFTVSVTALSFFMHPTSLLWLALLLAGWIYAFVAAPQPLVINGRQFSEREKLLGLSAISFITIFFLTNVGTLLLYALVFSGAVICAHGAFREPDNLFLDEGETQQSFLGMLTGQPTTGPVLGATNV